MRIKGLVLVLALTQLGSAAESVDLLTEKAAAALHDIDDHLEGVLGVTAIDLTSGRTLRYHADAVFPQASVIKLPIMLEAFRAGSLDRKVQIETKDARPGGDLYWLLQRGPATFTRLELVLHMIQSSDNTAANTLITTLGMDAINENSRRLGLTHTQLRRIMLDSAAVRAGNENTSTPDDIAALLRLIYERKVPGAEQMIEIMSKVDGDFRKTVPDATQVAAKVGEFPGTRTEAAIVLLNKRPYVVSVCSTFLRPGNNPIPDVASIVHRYFVKLAGSNVYGNRIE